ncbi:hypothetical protein F5882DRAFT_520814 [Hyaloscypha sp. PMI_1271]|nr:hypothetical protein F5882DRAFT_520814 [Hyaloscypha sp. PMI_1271]
MSHLNKTYSIDGLAPFPFDPANNDGRVAYLYDLHTNLLESNTYSDLHPTPSFLGARQYIFTRPLIFKPFDVATENFQLEDFIAALTSTPIDSSPLGFDLASASGSYSLPGGNDLNVWDLPAGMRDVALEGGYFMNGSGSTGNFQPLNSGSFVDNDFGLSFSSSSDTSTDENFKQGVGSYVPAPSTPWYDNNISWDPTLSTASTAQQNLNPTPTLTTNITEPAPSTAPASTPRRLDARFPCTHPPCTKTFKRDYECIRHENSLHVNTQGAHLCPITGCSRSQGKGYSRPDKVTEHLWKKHANLGYMKA